MVKLGLERGASTLVVKYLLWVQTYVRGRGGGWGGRGGWGSERGAALLKSEACSRGAEVPEVPVQRSSLLTAAHVVNYDVWLLGYRDA